MLHRLRAAMEPLPEIQAEKVKDILRAEAARPMRGGRAELPNDSLWGDGPKQLSLI